VLVAVLADRFALAIPGQSPPETAGILRSRQEGTATIGKAGTDDAQVRACRTCAADC
jgi:hypothetical protein